MQDQGKRLLLAVALAAGVWLVFTWTSSNKTPPAPEPGSAAEMVITSKPPVASERACVGSKVETFTFPSVIAETSSCGGTLVGWQLTDPRYVNDSSHGELVRKGSAPTGANEQGDFQLNFIDSDGTELLPDDVQWVGKRLNDHEVQYTLDLDGNHITKTFTLDPDADMIKLRYEATPAGKGQLVPTVTVYGWQDPKTDTSSSARVQPRVWQSTTFRDGEKLATADVEIGGPEGQPRKENDVQYTGFEHPYLMTVFAPHLSPQQVTKRTRGDSTGAMRTDIELEPVKAGSPHVHEVIGYLGPKNSELLEHADVVASAWVGDPKFDTGFKETIDFGHLPLVGVSLSIIGKPLLWMLGKIYSQVGNWGVAIILLTVIVKLLTLYWTTRSMRSMKAMAAVSPQVQEIQKKYPDDKQRAQVETMALYKQHNIRPLAGCAPMFLQIPIWSALYIMLSVTGELYLQPFIPGWIDDLTNTDPLHILPVALCAMMFVQARLTPQNTAQPGQKMMQYGMPLMFGFFSFYFPAGLTLYILTNTLLSSVHSIYMNRFDKKSMELAALLKKNKVAAEVRARSAEQDPAKAKPAAGEKRVKPTLKVVDAESVEREPGAPSTSRDTSDDDNEDVPDGVGSAAASAASQARRPRRKKRRR